MKENYIDAELVKKILSKYKRKPTDYKGIYGHALLIGGQYGYMGAVVLMALGALRSGVGKITAYIPKCGYDILQSSVPECIVSCDPNQEVLTSLPDLSIYKSIGIGPGMGRDRRTVKGVMEKLLINRSDKGLVIDADGLNIMAENDYMLRHLDENCVITPHPKEFLRLVSQQYNPMAVSDMKELNKLQHELVQTTKVVMVFKTHKTKVITTKQTYISTIGTNALATAGTGDLLTGIITGLLATGLSSVEASIVGVYVHSFAGVLAGNNLGNRSVRASDVINFIPNAFMSLEG